MRSLYLGKNLFHHSSPAVSSRVETATVSMLYSCILTLFFHAIQHRKFHLMFITKNLLPFQKFISIAIGEHLVLLTHPRLNPTSDDEGPFRRVY